jgi:hypothetical protein
MQTFLPYSNFQASARILDKKRCWKQVVEAAQIINVLEGRSVSWSKHPAVQMWQGSTLSLKEYFNAFLEVCIEKHSINTKYEFFVIPGEADDTPWWLGDHCFHKAMRARLIEKDEAFYAHLFISDKGFNNNKYLWPVMDGSQTFRII